MAHVPITWDDVTDMFPSDATLAALPEAAQDNILARVEELSASYFGGEDSAKFKLARIYLAAHLGTAPGLGGSGGSAGGPVTHREEGGVVESYASPTAAVMSSTYASTSYGRLFEELMRSSPRRIGLTS